MLQGLQGGFAPTRAQLHPQAIAPFNQAGQIQPVAAFQGFELGHALLQGRQALGITLQAGAIAIEITDQILQTGQTITAALAQRLHGAIKRLHLAQLLLTGGQMVEHRRRLVGPLEQTAHQGHHPFLQPHPMGQAVFLSRQPLALEGILQLGRLKIGQQLLQLGPLGLPLIPIQTRLLQSLGRLLPTAVGASNGLQQRLERLSGKAIQPPPLLARPGQLLGLALHREIEQQGPELLNLRPTHHHPVQPAAATEAVVREAPLAADQHVVVVSLQLLLRQPGDQGRREREAGLNHAALAAAPQQARRRTALHPPQQGIQRIEQDRFARTGFPGEHRESPAKRQLQTFDQGNVFEPQTREHGGCPKAVGGPADRSGSFFALEGVHPQTSPVALRPCGSPPWHGERPC